MIDDGDNESDCGDMEDVDEGVSKSPIRKMTEMSGVTLIV
jgi:hypothetical protein